MAKEKYECLTSLVLDDGLPHYEGETVELEERDAAYRVKRGWLRPLPRTNAPSDAEGEPEDGGSSEGAESEGDAEKPARRTRRAR